MRMSAIEWLSFLVTLCACALMTMVQCAPISCQMPSNLTLHGRFTRANSATRTLLLLPQEDSTMEISAAFMTHEHLYEPQECPEKLPTTGPLDDRSTCPFSNVIDHDPNRYPVTLTKAVCRCTGCFGQDENHHCEHLVYNIRVLKKTAECEDGFFVFEEAWYMIPVGCTCAKRPVADSITAPPEVDDEIEW